MRRKKAQFQADPAFAKSVLAATASLRDGVAGLEFQEPVTHVYNPLQYAWEMHAAYVARWGASPRGVLFLGMNPGPWGMAQTGVPFGEVAAVTRWLGLQAEVGKPTREHPKRPVEGLACARSEVSGRRLWEFFAAKFPSAREFFADHFILNYCPLVFMEAGGRNRTPDKLPAPESRALFALCDTYLEKLVELYQPQWLVGIGGFASRKLDGMFGKRGQQPGNRRLGTILHPSPASPAANRGWAEQAAAQLQAQGIW